MMLVKTIVTIALAGIAIAEANDTLTTVKCQEPLTIVFDYATKNSVPPGSAGLTIGLINPGFNVTGISGTKLSKTFSESLGKDLEEMLTAKGFKIQGPFASIDEMVYSEKQKCDFVMEVTAMPEIQAVGTYYTSGDGKTKPIDYRYAGTGSLTGKINIVLYEPMSREKVWTKSVVIPPVENIKLDECKAWTAQVIVLDDPNIYNEVGKALQNSYNNILTKIDSHITKEEWAPIHRPAKKP